jgi:hypothetical protein
MVCVLGYAKIGSGGATFHWKALPMPRGATGPVVLGIHEHQQR